MVVDELIRDGNLTSFHEMFLSLFLWVLLSAIFVYGLAAAIGFWTLHKHKQGRWYCVTVISVGLFMPLTGGVISSAFIATVYQSLAWHMPARMALIWGTGQTVLAIGLSFTRLLPTL